MRELILHQAKLTFQRGGCLKKCIYKHGNVNVLLPKARTNPVASSWLILPLDSEHIAELTCVTAPAAL